MCIYIYILFKKGKKIRLNRCCVILSKYYTENITLKIKETLNYKGVYFKKKLESYVYLAKKF